MSWLTEHGKEYAVPEKIAKHFFDMSWHNDACPSFCHPLQQGSDGARLVTLWVDHPNPEMRECSQKRFAITVNDPEGDQIQERTQETDNLEKALALFEQALQNAVRFVWLVGAVHEGGALARELWKDLPEATTDGSLVLWDRKHKQPVITVHKQYGQAICLESQRRQPFTDMAQWFNGTTDEAFKSEGIPT